MMIVFVYVANVPFQWSTRNRVALYRHLLLTNVIETVRRICWSSVDSRDSPTLYLSNNDIEHRFIQMSWDCNHQRSRSAYREVRCRIWSCPCSLLLWHFEQHFDHICYVRGWSDVACGPYSCTDWRRGHSEEVSAKQCTDSKAWTLLGRKISNCEVLWRRILSANHN